MDIITSVTILLVVGACIWFGNKFLTAAKAHEAALAEEIKALYKQDVAEVQKLVTEAHTKVDGVKAELKKDVEGLFENQKNITTAINIAGRTPTGIQSIFDRMPKPKQQ